MKSKRPGLIRILKWIAALSVWASLTLSIWKVFSYIDRQEAKHRRRERIKKALITTAVSIGSVAATLVGLKYLLKYLRKLKNGYLFDFFDREKYDIIENGSDDRLDSGIREELKMNIGDEEETGHKPLNSVPLDEEASERDFVDIPRP